jgi:hypothetical protein
LSGRPWWLWSSAVFLIALAATAPTTGDIGLTWDEPAYRYSQMVSAQWWEQLAQARSWNQARNLVDSDALLYYWPYGRIGINFHPPLSGQLSLLTHRIFGSWLKDIPSRRMASVFEYSLTIAILFGFLAARYGRWVGGVAAGALLLMPRVYGDGHIAGTDTLGLLLWAAIAIAFWNGLYSRHAGRWRAWLGALVGLAFVQKMATVAVIVPLGLWLSIACAPTLLRSKLRAWAWADLAIIGLGLIVPLFLAGFEIVRIAGMLPPPGQTDLFVHRPLAQWPGAILAIPLVVWIIRRFLFHAFRGHPVWGVERPALETWTAVVAIAPSVALIGNPLWWRETFTRLAHYFMLNAARRGALPDIPTYYRGEIYPYGLPWENAWVLMAITVPAAILVASLLGLGYTLRVARRDSLPAYFLLHLVTLPVIRMMGTPAHDGVRLFLPTFFFVAAMAGWGTDWASGILERLTRLPGRLVRMGLTLAVLGPAAWQLAAIHPYELSYYNELIGGPSGAWASGFELSYWFEPYNSVTIAEINDRLPSGANVDFFNPMATPETFAELQSLGELRPDIRLGARSPHEFPFVWLLTQDSKATAFTRLLFAMKPWYESRPRPLGGLRIASVADPVAVSRAWALQLLLDAPSGAPPEPLAPAWARRHAPWLGWLWGDNVPRAKRIQILRTAMEWASRDPDGLRLAAKALADGRAPLSDNARRLENILARHDPLDPPGRLSSERLLRGRPAALIEAIEILIQLPDELRAVMLSHHYTDVSRSDGYLDRHLP